MSGGDVIVKAQSVVLPDRVLEGGAVRVREGRIAEIGVGIRPAAGEASLSGRWLLPGFIDLHWHGYSGFGLMTTDDAREAVRRVAGSGVTTCYAGLGAGGSLDVIAQSVTQAAAVVGTETGGARLAGVFMEGPFISVEKKGAWTPKNLRLPRIDELWALIGAAGGRIRRVNVAPELPGALEFIRAACQAGIVVSIGHSNATYDEAMAGVAAGATIVNHTYNAMSGLGHRAPGLVGAALTTDALLAELILDGEHVYRAAAQALFRARGPRGVALITDGSQLTGMPAGTYERGGRTLTVRGAVCQLPDGTLAGSVSPLDRDLRNARAWLTESPADLAAMSSGNAARAIWCSWTRRGRSLPRSSPARWCTAATPARPARRRQRSVRSRRDADGQRMPRHGRVMSVQPVRIGVVGCGLIARRAHLPAYGASAEAEVVAVCSGRRETAARTAAEFGVPRVHDDWQALIHDPDVEAVDICAPNALHAPAAIAAARAGKHVLVEKPMALSLTEADAMIAAAREASRVLMVAHNLRYQPVYEALKRVVADGVIGTPLAARGVFMHAGPDEFWGATSDWFWHEQTAGGGALLDMGIHMIDLLRWFVGEPVVEVSAMTARLEKPTFADDNAIVLLRFAGGAIASMQASWTARPFPDREVVVHGTRGHISLGRSQQEPLLVHVQDAGPETARQVQVDVAETSEFVNPFVHFVRVIRGGLPLLTSGEEGRETLAVTLAAYEAARTGCKVMLTPGR